MHENDDVMLTKDFSLYDMYRSATADRMGIDNTPDDEIIERLKNLCVCLLQPIRNYYKKPIIINSGYRCLEVNRAVKSKDTSAHILGYAADIEIAGISNYKLAKEISENFDYNKIILEYCEIGKINSGWVHIEYISADKNKQELYTINSAGTRKGLVQ